MQNKSQSSNFKRLFSSFQTRVSDVYQQSRWVLRYSWQIERRWLLIILAAAAIANALPAGVLWAGRELINSIADVLNGEALTDDILFWLIVTLVAMVVIDGVSGMQQYANRRLADSLNLNITLDILEHSAKLDLLHYEDPTFQDIAERAKKNNSGRFIAFLNQLITTISNVIQAIGISLILLAIDPLIVTVFILLVIPFIVFRLIMARRAYSAVFERTTKRRLIGYFTALMTNRRSVPEVRLLNLAPVLTQRFRALFQEFIDEDRRIYTIAIAGTTALSIIYIFAFILLYNRLISGVLGTTLTIGDVVLFAGAANRMRALMTNTANIASNTVENTMYISNLAEFFEVEPRVPLDQGKQIDLTRGEIRFENVTFAYPGTTRPVINNLSLHIAPGETIAFVGENGAGKTTLVKLLARLYEVDSGTIYVDGTSTQELAPECLYRQIAFVFQRFNRYEATLSENIAFGDWKHITSREQVEAVAKNSQIEPLIAGLPEQYDTLLGRKFGNHELSGGQWQQLAIARAVARDSARLLILDEPTSNLDARAEYELFSRFKALAQGRTTIIISHRFSTVSLADRIIVLDQGQIVEQGSHQELMEHGGQYASLYQLHETQMNMSSSDDSAIS